VCVFDIAFVVSGSTLPFENPFDALTVPSVIEGLRVLSSVEGLTALSTSKGYRTTNAMRVSILARAGKVHLYNSR